MAGAMQKVDYVLEDGTTCHTQMPTWAAQLQGATPSTSLVSCPKFIRYRKRYFRFNATGQERHMRVISPTNAIWTDAYGVGVIVPTLGTATPTAANATLSGRTGGSDKNR